MTVRACEHIRRVIAFALSSIARAAASPAHKGENSFLPGPSAASRDGAARLGVTPATIDNARWSSFGRRQVSVIYQAPNQYHVLMGIDPRSA